MSLTFPENESEKRKHIEDLMAEWKCLVKHDHFVRDGFYPYYWNQPIRLLVIGREGRGLTNRDHTDKDYIDVLLNDGYWVSKIGGRQINTLPFQRRLMKVVYGIVKGFPAFKEVPDAATIGRMVAKENGISFAWMNLSKESNNDDKNWQTNATIFNRSFNESMKAGLIGKEIELLSPQVIISMNEGGRVKEVLEKVADVAPRNNPPKWIKGAYDVTFKNLENSGKAIWLDTYHFAAHNTRYIKVNDEDSFYNPICSMLKGDMI